jgi:hypothetical protein
MFKYFITLLFFLSSLSLLNAQTINPAPDTLQKKVYTYKIVKDSAFLARQKFVTDSIITHTWLIPDSLLNKNVIMDSIMKMKVYSRPANEPWYKIYNNKKSHSYYKTGKLLPHGKVWILAATAFLLILFSILRYTFAKPLQTIIQSFFSNRVLNNLNKEDNLFTSWPFLLLFIQFGFTIGMFVYLVVLHYHIAYATNGFQFFLTISVLIVLLFAFKIVFLRFIGHLFNIQKPVHEYISILYLSYFNISLIFIPLVVAFALSPLKYGTYYIVSSFVILTIIFTFQFIRATVYILSHYRFSKVYLFLYFCALEICPILILIKAIDL